MSSAFRVVSNFRRWGAAAACLLVLNIGACVAAEDDAKVPEILAQSERVLVGTVDKPVTDEGGVTFAAKINRVLRGGGQRGGEVEIRVVSEDAKKLSYAAGKSYLFFLKRVPNVKGWRAIGAAAVPAEDKSVNLGGRKVTYEELAKQVAASPFASSETMGRKTLAGKWSIVRSQRGNDFYVWIVEFPEGKDGPVKLVSSSEIGGASAIESSRVDGESFEVVIKSGDNAIKLTGRLAGDFAPALLAVDQGEPEPCRLVATDLDSLKRVKSPVPSPGRNQFAAIMNQEKPYGELRDFITRNPRTPMQFDAYRLCFALSQEEQLSADDLRSLANEFVKSAETWSPGYGERAKQDVAALLSRIGYMHEVGLEFLEQVLAKLPKNASEERRNDLTLVKAQLLKGAGKVEQAFELFRALRKSMPLDSSVTLAIAEGALAAGRIDEALPLYAELAVLPMMERMVAREMSSNNQPIDRDQLPSSIVRALYKEKNGNTDGLEEYLDKVYHERLTSFARSRVEPRAATAGNRVVLCELLTGSECPPCVAADVASSGLEATFAPTEVIVVRYHLHIPGPDPLTNNASEERFGYYAAQGTPHMRVNGREIPVGGFMPNVPGAYSELLAAAAPALEERTDLKIKVTAKAKDGKVQIAVNAGGIKLPSKARLRVLLVEDKVEFMAGNGVRSHEFIVRAMPGGADGLEIGGDIEAAMNETVDLFELKKELARYLVNFEEKNSFKFRAKPLDLARLHVVAFVQDDANRNVLQAIAVPVTGDLSTPEIPDLQPKVKEEGEEGDGEGEDFPNE